MLREPIEIFIGYDDREREAYEVCRYSIGRRASVPVEIRKLDLTDLVGSGLYTRTTGVREGRYFDAVSDQPMATEFAISRFLVPWLARRRWAVFMDCDILAVEDIARILDGPMEIDGGRAPAVWCVKHEHHPPPGVKMDGQLQTAYRRKNWSSVMLFDASHPAHAALTPHFINGTPGRDLHGFCWLRDEEIGALDARWNWLAGHSDPNIDPALVHYTEGGPWFPEFAQPKIRRGIDEHWFERWRQERRLMDRIDVSALRRAMFPTGER